MHFRAIIMQIPDFAKGMIFLNSTFSYLTEEKWEKKPLKTLKKQAKRLKKQLKSRPDLQENRLVEKQLLWLISEKGDYRVNFRGDLPLTGTAVTELDVIDDDGVIAALSALAAHSYICSSDVESLLYQTVFCLINTAFQFPEKAAACISRLYAALDLDTERITREVNPLEAAFRKDSLYPDLTAGTRAVYREKTAAVADSTGIPEDRLAFEYMTRAEKEKKHIGEIIYADFRRVFPLMSVKAYIALLLGISVLLTALTMLFTPWYCGIFTLVLWLGGIKPIIDHGVSRHVKGNSLLPKIEFNGKIPDNAKTLCVLSCLISSEKDIYGAIERLSEAKSRNPSENISFCLLADFAPCKNPESPDDKRLIKLINSLEKDIIIIVRKREFSPTMKGYQGRERKRGAIEDLVRFIKGERVEWRYISCERNSLSEARFMVCLDYDTAPLMDSITDLVSAALHPLNAQYGIIAPRITTSLSSSLKSKFAALMSGGGGCSNISLYDNFSGEFYYDCFGEGIFTGKGLIRIDEYYKKAVRAFPEEKILSHDILEGSLLNVGFAGDCEFSESFPRDSRAYYKRRHRWLRGDFQNVDFLSDKRFSLLSKFRLWDNLRRGIMPVFIFAVLLLGTMAHNGWLLVWIAVHSVLVRYVMSFIPAFIDGITFSNTRQFYSPVLSRTREIFTQSLFALILIPKNCAVSLDAFFRCFVRRNFTKHRLLEWSTASSFETGGKLHFMHFAAAEILSLWLFVMSVLYGELYTGVLSLLCLCAMPVMLYCDRENAFPQVCIKGQMREELVDLCRRMWQFYRDFATEEHNFLPPDNVQFSPVFRVSARTSPTNIGFYLLSCLCAKMLDIISLEEFTHRVESTLEAVERLEKWKGHLYNWYDTHTLGKLNGFVSTVDSGNFESCLLTLENALREMKLCSLAEKARDLQKGDFAALYDSRKNLFYIGFDADKNEMAKNHYDLLMSEARLTSYYAIAKGQIPKKHWRSLGRTMSRKGFYAGPCAWTGTTFEYFMPELLLKSPVGSVGYEALKYAVHCQKGRGAEMNTPYGISESGYFAFDGSLNYQYKAHGVQKLGLKGGLDKEQVVSPYSSFLMLELDPFSAWNNLERLERLGALNERYGFYEAVDFTPDRVGDKAYAIVRSHMAHHVGMSMCGAVNALCGGALQRYFIGDKRMKRGTELLEEKLMTGEKILKIDEQHKEKAPSENETEEFSDIRLEKPRVNLLSNGRLTLITADNGIVTGYFDNRLTCMKTTDPLMRPRGMFFGITENGKPMPFYVHPYGKSEFTEQQTAFSPQSTAYYADKNGILGGMRVYVHRELNAEIRDFALENTGLSKRQLTLFAYIEPALASERDIKAHPAFSDLFLKIEYNKEHSLFIACRKERHSDKKTYMCVGFREETDYTFSFNREECLESGKPFAFTEKAEERSSTGNHVPSPCIFLKADISLDAHTKQDLRLFICYGNDREQVISDALKLREETDCTAERLTSSPLVRNTIAGRMAAACLPYILYGGNRNEEAVNKNRLDKRGLWRYGISGDNPIIIFDCKREISRINHIMQLQKALAACQIKTDLIVLCENQLQKAIAEKSRTETGGDCNIFVRECLEEEMTALMYGAADYVFSGDNEESTSAEGSFLPVSGCMPDNDAEGFSRGKFACKSANHPWCNVIANSSFGTLVSQNSLGFTWAMNSRENKLTPWDNDITRDNSGEMLLIKRRGMYYDLVKGSKAVFSPNAAEYFGRVKHIRSHIEVNVPRKGMAKIIGVTLENTSDKAIDFELCWYNEPFPEYRGFVKVTKTEEGIVFENPANTVYKGALALTCNKEISGFNRNKYAFWKGVSDSQPTSHICGAIRIKIKLPPKSKEYVKFILSYTMNEKKPFSMAKAAENQPLDPDFENSIKLKSDNKTLDELFNHWLPCQIIGGRIWARTGFYQNGGAYGFRDQLQDSTAALYLSPKICKRQILRACASQFEEGDVLHWWHELHGARKGVRTRYSDDMLWLPYTLCRYAEFTEDYSLLDIPVAYCAGDKLKENQHEAYFETERGEKASVYEHARAAMEKGYAPGEHGLLLMGCGDWNDSYNNVGIKGKGESVWLSMFYVLTAKMFAPLAEKYGDKAYSDLLSERVERLEKAIDEAAWDGEYYLRAFFDNGDKMGGKDCSMCRIDLLPQAFAALADLPRKDRIKTALNSAYEQLCDIENGIVRLFYPPFSEKGLENDPGYVKSYPEGVRENGGQYTHAAVWLAMAFYRVGDAEKGEKLLEILNPANRNDRFKNEPYFMTADIYTNPSAFGRGGWSVYTGAAGWYYRLILENVLGLEVKGREISAKPFCSFEKAELDLKLFDTKIHFSIEKGNEKGMFFGGEKVGKIPADGKEKSVNLLI